jgi:hypothetical protein
MERDGFQPHHSGGGNGQRDAPVLERAVIPGGGVIGMIIAVRGIGSLGGVGGDGRKEAGEKGKCGRADGNEPADEQERDKKAAERFNEADSTKSKRNYNW